MSLRTVISSFVSVPVLSEQMTETLPSVSIAGRRRTSALRFTIRCAASVSEIVVTAGRASGTTATASAVPNRSISRKGWPRNSPRATTTSTTTSAARARTIATWSSPSCSGVFARSIVSSIRAMPPNSVSMPVATTSARPRPYVTAVPA
jgi:hypothetical protein